MNVDWKRAIGLAGPTASGKSAVALHLAGLVEGEIVSVDSMQVYRGLDVGTAKPAREEQRRVPHHLIDVVEVTEPFDVGRFTALATAVAREIVARRHTPILCGGSGLYFKALLGGLDVLPPASLPLRRQLGSIPLPELVRELQERDPAGAQQVDLANRRRVERAVELLRLTGRPLAENRTRWVAPGAGSPPPLFLLIRQPGDLRQRIDDRVDQMFANGWVDETRRLLARGLTECRTALQAIGYRQVIEHLEGRRDLPATIALVKARTWQLARRQLTWFRHQLPVIPLGVPPGEEAGLTARRIAGFEVGQVSDTALKSGDS